MCLQNLKNLKTWRVNRRPIKLRIVESARYCVIKFRKNLEMKVALLPCWNSVQLPPEIPVDFMNKYFGQFWYFEDKEAWKKFEDMVQRNFNKLPKMYADFMRKFFALYSYYFVVKKKLDEITFSNFELLRDYAILLCWTYNKLSFQSEFLQHLFEAKLVMTAFRSGRLSVMLFKCMYQNFDSYWKCLDVDLWKKFEKLVDCNGDDLPDKYPIFMKEYLALYCQSFNIDRKLDKEALSSPSLFLLRVYPILLCLAYNPRCKPEFRRHLFEAKRVFMNQ